MNQEHIGKFIAGCRKEKGLTQVQLAEKLNITDRAVSKWETGKSMPDSSIVLELCHILGISVNELFSGERIDMGHYSEKVDENLIALKQQDERNSHRNKAIAIIYTIVMASGILICCICDMATSGAFTWSLITLSAIGIAWLVSFPVILAGKRGILAAILALSICIIPFMYLLSCILKMHAVFRIGAVMSMIALIYMWTIYALYSCRRIRKLFATGIALVLAVPCMLCINIVLSKMIGEPILDVWDILAMLMLLITAGAFIYGDYVHRRRHSGQWFKCYGTN